MKVQQQLTQREKRDKIKELLIKHPELSTREIGKRAGGVSKTTVGKIKNELIEDGLIGREDISSNKDCPSHPMLDNHPWLYDSLSERGKSAIRAKGVLDKMQEHGTKSPVYAQRLLSKEKKHRRKSQPIKITARKCKLFLADLRDDLTQVPDESVNLIFCDMPDRKINKDLYKSLSFLAGRTLVDGGVLACMTGTLNLPAFLSELSICKELEYIGAISVVNNKALGKYRHKNVDTNWKIVIIMSRGNYSGEWFTDVIQAPPDPDNNNKKYHQDGQSEEVVTKIIEMFSRTGDTVADFCVGGGTTAYCALRAGRYFIASDIDSYYVEKTRKRVMPLLEVEVEEPE